LFPGHALSSRTFGGALTGSGSLTHSPMESLHEACLSFEEISVEELWSTWSEDRAQPPLIRAKASGSLEISKPVGHPDRLSGTGTLTLSRPEYMLLKKMEGSFSSYDLPLPPLEGKDPCLCRLVLDPERVLLADISGSLEGISFSGEISCSWTGQIEGRLDLGLERAYVAQSTLLSLTGALGGMLVVPVGISGSIASPNTSVDLAATLGRFLSVTHVTSTVANLVGALLGAGVQEGPKPTPQIDRWLDQIVAGGPDADEAIKGLTGSGITAEQAITLLEQHKKRRGRAS